MNVENLKKLINLLIEDAERPDGVKFDMCVWTDTETEDEEPSWSCGTQACAMGLAAISGRFPGLELSENGEPKLSRDYGASDYGLFAAMALFGIDYVSASFLFLPSHYGVDFRSSARAELEVVNRIKDLIETWSWVESMERAARRNTNASWSRMT